MRLLARAPQPDAVLAAVARDEAVRGQLARALDRPPRAETAGRDVVHHASLVTLASVLDLPRGVTSRELLARASATEQSSSSVITTITSVGALQRALHPRSAARSRKRRPRAANRVGDQDRLARSSRARRTRTLPLETWVRIAGARSSAVGRAERARCSPRSSEPHSGSVPIGSDPAALACRAACSRRGPWVLRDRRAAGRDEAFTADVRRSDARCARPIDFRFPTPRRQRQAARRDLGAEDPRPAPHRRLTGASALRLRLAERPLNTSTPRGSTSRLRSRGRR